MLMPAEVSEDDLFLLHGAQHLDFPKPDDIEAVARLPGLDDDLAGFVAADTHLVRQPLPLLQGEHLKDRNLPEGLDKLGLPGLAECFGGGPDRVQQLRPRPGNGDQPMGLGPCGRSVGGGL